MKRLATTVCTFLLMAGFTATPALAGAQTKWQGYLVDRGCADSVRNDSDPTTFVQNHTKDCALMPNCQAKGYSIYATSPECKWLDLDKKGNDLALRLLKASKRRIGFYVEVTGTAKKQVLKTQNIEEIEEPKAQ
ncbi:MAG: hypothetical protein U0105_10820 [Candidatus Obscuribacterales bacterium]